MNNISWVKELVQFDQQIEESGMIDFSAGFDPEKELISQSFEFMIEVKNLFVNMASSFNQLKGGGLGNIKVYGISNTHADFMLFRNGYKLIFSLAEAGKIAVRSRYQGASIVPGSLAAENHKEVHENDDYLVASWGAFGQLKWTYRNELIDNHHMVRYYLSKFVRESAK